MRSNMREHESYGPSLLMAACRSGFIECANVLLDHNADVNYAHVYRLFSVLKSACLGGNADLLRLIIGRGATINDLEIWYLVGEVEVMCNNEIATTLVGHMKDVNFVFNYQPILYKACYGGNMNAVKVLLERGARLEDSGIIHVYDPLVSAACHGHLEVMKLLLSWNATDERISLRRVKTALSIASRFGHIQVIQCLVE